MVVVFYLLLIWALSSIVGSGYMVYRTKDPNLTRIVVVLVPVVNTLFALAVIIFALVAGISRVKMKPIVKEFKDIKNDNL